MLVLLERSTSPLVRQFKLARLLKAPVFCALMLSCDHRFIKQSVAPATVILVLETEGAGRS